METAPQSNSFLFASDGSDQDHTAVEAGVRASLKAQIVQSFVPCISLEQSSGL